MYSIENLIKELNTNWKELLLEIVNENQGYIESIDTFLNQQKEEFDGIQEIYPKKDLIFNAFNKFNVEDTKVLILGQDPYHGPNQAQGLCFSVPKEIKKPPSLNRIFREIKDDMRIDIPESGDLNRWAKQGVLLLNTTFTVRQRSPTSHSKIWKEFTNLVLQKLAKKCPNLICLLWGNHAKSYKKILNQNNVFLEAKHPSPLGSNRGGWFGCKHFSKCNQILIDKGKDPINW
jgi:uracil-DNA glycosylase